MATRGGVKLRGVIKMGQSKVLPVSGGYHVWTRQEGSGDRHLLTLHGGPGANHEYLEVFERHQDELGVTFHYYDQLGSYYSDQPDDPDLWVVDRFAEEVEDVRQGLGLDRLVLYGQSWGGVLAIEYALRHPEHLDGLVISNMTASFDAYVSYIGELRQRLPLDIQERLNTYEAARDYFNPTYQDLVQRHLYQHYLCRLDPWPETVVRGFARIAMPVYETMNGPNEFVPTGNLKDWDRWEDLSRIQVPTLLLVGRYDTMRVADIEEMGRRMPHATVGICEQGSHLAMWDDEAEYFRLLSQFLRTL